MKNPLRINQRLVTSPFGLLGTDENALTFALGYTFQQCFPFLHWFLWEIGIKGIQQKALRTARIHLQRHRSEEPNQGITDIEIHLPGKFHIVIEAKVGLAIPSIEQCQKYIPRLVKSNEPIQLIVALVQSVDDSSKAEYSIDCLEMRNRLKWFNWSEFFPLCIKLMTENSVEAESTSWVHAFYRFLDEEYGMKAFTTEVWILAIDTGPLWPEGMSFWDIHQKYHLYFDSHHPTVRPLYFAFRVDGKVDAIYRVCRIEQGGARVIDSVPELKNVEKDWTTKPLTIWHFGPAIPLAKPIRTGSGMYSRRVRCDLDLLLTCETVKEIEKAMSKRRDQLQLTETL